ncbi:MAG TPA: GNAT family N-acetyltransferase, partial [Saprospiraceae bacterium]|nr:GNAT family N-acetyltransferase [Saprospiraceae bacterium]
EKNAELHIENLIEGFPPYSILDVSLRSLAGLASISEYAKVNLRYSYIISRNQNIEGVKSKYNEGLRRNLREAEKKYSIIKTNDVATFIQFINSTYAQRKTKPPAWLETSVPRAYEALQKHQKGYLEFAYYEGKPIAGIMTGWDELNAYYFIGGRTPDDGGASAHALLLDNAIQRACENGQSFDFEGSMHSGIANFFQSFGATPEPFWRIRKFKGIGKLWSTFKP